MANPTHAQVLEEMLLENGENWADLTHASMAGKIYRYSEITAGLLAGEFIAWTKKFVYYSSPDNNPEGGPLMFFAPRNPPVPQ